MAWAIEIDTVYGLGGEEDTIERVCEDLASDVGGDLRWRVVNPHGPGGGWPIVEWASEEREPLERLLREHYEFDDEEVDHWLIGPRGL